MVEEGVFDRGELSHAVDLFDMDQRYADVITIDEAPTYLAGVEITPDRDRPAA